MKLSMQTLKCIRIRISDGGAKLFVLLHNKDNLSRAIDSALSMMSRHVQIGKDDFAKLASSYTLHGPLLVLKYLLADEDAVWTAVQTRVVLAECGAVLELCSPFVCDQTLERFSENVKIAQVQHDEEGDEENEDEDEDEDDLSGGNTCVFSVFCIVLFVF
jgi:hypothetical protein